MRFREVDEKSKESQTRLREVDEKSTAPPRHADTSALANRILGPSSNWAPEHMHSSNSARSNLRLKRLAFYSRWPEGGPCSLAQTALCCAEERMKLRVALTVSSTYQSHRESPAERGVARGAGAAGTHDALEAGRLECHVHLQLQVVLGGVVARVAVVEARRHQPQREFLQLD